MEVHTFVHKETKEIIRSHFFDGIEEFGVKYFLTEDDYGTLFFVNTKEEIDFILENKDFMHPFDSCNCNKPSAELVNLDDYEIKKFTLND